MKLNLICGGVGSGKTYECISVIESIKESDSEARIMFIVPEQFSYSAERLITSHFGGTGLNNIEVLTFSQMSLRFLNRAKKNYLTPAGKAVLVRKAVNDISSDENIYAGSAEKPGFSKNISEIISELKRCMISTQILKNTAQKLSDGMLKRKLESIAEIYERYEQLNDGRFYDSDEDLNVLSEQIYKESILDGAHVFFDEFADFLPQHYRVIEAMLKKCGQVYITLPVDDALEELAEIPRNTKDRLFKIALKNNIEISEVNLNKKKEHFSSEEIRFYFENYESFNRHDFIPYQDETKDISLFFGRDPYSEAENAAKCIRQLVDLQNMRYSDIAVACGDSDEYMSIVQGVFRNYKIPYFTDVKLAVTDHPVILTVLSLFDILKENWSYDSVFRYLKSGFVYIKNEEQICELNSDDIDLLDSYVLKRGIRGKKKWLDDKDWEYFSGSLADSVFEHKSEDEIEKADYINSVRRKIISPVKNFAQKTTGRKTVREFSQTLFDFLEDIYLYDGLQSEIERLNRENMRNEAEQISQIWNLFVNILDQIVTAIGSEKCSREEFRSYIYAGLGANEISIIPSSIDSVKVSSADAARQNGVEALFIIGAVRGKIPCEVSNEGMLTDKERNELSVLLGEEELEIGTDTRAMKKSEEYKLYRVIFTAKKSLFISYPLNSFEGDAQMPSQMVLDIGKIFKEIKCSTDLEAKNEGFFTVNSAFDYLLKNRNNKNDITAKQIFKWFSEHEEHREKLQTIKNADVYKIEKAKIQPEIAELLYGSRRSYSVSRLNVHSQCPFKYFASYGLEAKPEEIWQIHKFDLGSIMHLAICRFCEQIEDGAESFEELRRKWLALTAEASGILIDRIMSELEKEIIPTLERDEGKVRYLILRMTKILKRAAETIRISISKGEYTAVEHEKRFNICLNYSGHDVLVNGTIDRIDAAYPKGKESAGIRIIDYKSGKKDFSVVSICNMQDIQLVVYAAAAAELYREGRIKYTDSSYTAKITGIMYNKLRDDFISNDGENKGKIEDLIQKQQRMEGVVILETDNDEKEEERFDISEAFFMDRELEERGTSSYLKLDMKKNGELKKTSSVMSRNSFNKLIDYAVKNIAKADRNIMSGNISIMPYKDKNALACTYCDMAEICLFDYERDSVRNLCSEENEAWEIIDNELKKD